MPPPWLEPKVSPPRKRLSLVIRPDGRLRRSRAALTKALLRAGIVDPDVTRNRPHTDPVYVGWQAECRRITTEWDHARSADTDNQRWTQLVTFAERH